MKRFVPHILIIVLTAIAYLQLPGNVFVDMDDQLLIISNETAHGLTWPHMKAAFTTYDPELYVPLTLLSYQVEYSLFGLQPTVFHLTNLLLHMGSALLVFAIFGRFFSRTSALCCALLFALHPINVEAVAWASGRKDVLSSFFFLLSVLLYLQRRSRLSIACFAAGLLSKVSIAPLPAVLLLLDWVQGRQLNRSAIQEKLPYFILSGVFMVIAILGKPQAGHMLTWVLLSFVGIPFYLRAYLAPVRLSILYPFTAEPTLVNPWILGGVVLVGLLFLLSVLSLKRTKTILFAWLWFLLLLLPAFPTVLKGGGDTIAMLYYASDRYVYLAGLSVLFLVGYALDYSTASWKYNVPYVVAALFGVLTFAQVGIWRDSESLYRNVLAQGRESHVAYLSLARLAGERGNLDESLRLYTTSNEIKENSKALLNIGQIQVLKGDYQAAIATYEHVIERWPDLADVHEHIGRLYLQLGEVGTAAPYFVRAIEIEPTYAPAYFHLGIIFELNGQNTEAIAAFMKVLELEPGDAQVQRKLRELGAL